MTKTLKEKTISALFWNFVDKFGQQFMLIIVGIILIRILTPADYGLIGLLSIFIAFSSIFIDSGFGYVLVRKKDALEKDFSTVFIFNIVIGISLYIILFFCAPLIANFYDQPQLVIIIRVLFISIPISALGTIQNIVLVRHLLFKSIAKAGLFAVLLSGAISITLSISGFGVWALVVQTLSLSFFRTLFLWVWGKWKISFVFDFLLLKEGFAFSSNILAVNSLTVISNNIYTSTIGKFFSINQVGYYSQASKLSELPNVLTGVVQSSMYPVLSKIHDDEIRFKRACRKTGRTLSFLFFPVIIGLICTADPLFKVLLTEKWMPAIPYFQLLCAAMFFSPFLALNTSFLYAKGFPNTVLKLEVFKFLLIMLSLILTIKLGIIQVIIGLIVVRLINLIVVTTIGGKKIDYTFWEQCKDMLPYVAISLMMGGIVYSLSYLIDNLYILLILQIITGGAVYIIANKILGSKIFEEVKDMIFKNVKIRSIQESDDGKSR